MKPHYGGQALIEGVLIRGRSGVFAAVRAPDGRLITREEALPAGRRGRLGKVPVLRGVLALGDTISIGSRMLMFSADVAAGGTGDSMSPMSKRATLGAASIAAVAFAILPSVLTGWLRRRKGEPPRTGIGSSLLEGGVRFGVLVGYLSAISRLQEVQRIFAYHGAEHKSISALEADADLTPESVQRFDTAHPRCGTAFLLQSMLTSTAVYAFIGSRSPLGRVATRVALIPVIAGVSYEVLQFNARHLDSAIVKALNAPGMLLQRMTTRQPTDEQVEVAISALRGAMAMDQRSE
jgi:uncharacterized protein YqhQ